MSLSQAVAAEVRAQRARLGDGRAVSQQAMADAIGQSQNYVSRRIRGVEPWKLEDLEVLAPILGTSVRDIIIGATSRPAYDVDESPDTIEE
jgi:transcriptional regulator with XRE-family HTH domain